jgi:hypothetical protein
MKLIKTPADPSKNHGLILTPSAFWPFDQKWNHSRNSHDHTDCETSLDGNVLRGQGGEIVTSRIDILEYRRKDGRISETHCNEETSGSSLGIVILSEDDVEVCQGVPDEFPASDSGRGDGDDHTDQGGDEL